MNTKEYFLENLPGENGWWQYESYETCKEVYESLQKILPEIVIQEVIEKIYWSAANQYQ